MEEPHHRVGVFEVNPPSAEAARQTPPPRREIFPEPPQSQREGDAAAGASGRGDSAQRPSWWSTDGEASRHPSEGDPNQCTPGPAAEVSSRPTWRENDGGGGGGGSRIHRRTDERRDSRHFQAPVGLAMAPPGEAKGSGLPFMAHRRYFHR